MQIKNKTFFVLDLRISKCDVTSGGVFVFFWPNSPGPGRQPNKPLFWLKIFWKLGQNLRL